MLFGLLLWLQFGFGVQTGTLSVEHPDTRAVVVIGDYRREFASGDTLVLPEGELQLRFGFPSYRDVLVTVTIRPDQSSHLRLDPKPLKNERERALHSVFPAVAWQANLIMETDHRSRLSLNGEPLDSTVVALQLEPGRYKLEAVDAYGRRRTKNMNISATRLTYVDMTNPQPKDRLSRAAFVPGLAQYHRNEVVKSVLFAGGLGALAYFSFLESYQYNRASNRYDQTREAYANVISPEDLIILADRGIRQAEVANTALRHRNIVWSAFLAAYVWNVMDGRRPGPAGYRTSPPKVSPFVHPDEAGLRISW